MMVRYQLVEEVGDPTIGNISNQRIQKERPRHWVQQRLLNLVRLEMLIPDSLLVFAHASDGQHAVFFLQPPGVKLAVRDHPVENSAQGDG